MFGWFDKLRGSKGKNIQNLAGLSENEVKLLADDFKCLSKHGADLPGRIMLYLLDGDGEDVLASLRKASGAGFTLGLKVNTRHAPFDESQCSARKQFFEQLTTRNHQFFSRLAQVYLAAACSSPMNIEGRGLPDWAEIFLLEATRCNVMVWPNKDIKTRLNAEAMESVLVEMGCSPDLLVRAVFFVLHHGWENLDCAFPGICRYIDGFNDAVIRHASVVQEALRHNKNEYRVNALELLDKMELGIGPFANDVVEQAVSSSSKARSAAVPLLHRNPDVAAPLLKEKLTSGKPDERIQAVRMLALVLGDAAAEVLEEQFKCETSDKVKQELASLLKRTEAQQAEPSKSQFNLPLIEPVETVLPLPDSAFSVFLAINPDKLNRQAFEVVQGISKGGGSFEECEQHKTNSWYGDWMQQHQRVVDFAQLEGARLIHLVRLFVILGWISWDRVEHFYDRHIRAYDSSHGIRTGLREFAAVLRAIGVEPEVIAWCRLTSHLSPNDWDDDLTWPYFVEHMYILEEVLGVRPMSRQLAFYQVSDARIRALRTLATFPEPPAQLAPVLWEIALGSSKTESPIARKCLENAWDKEQVLIDALKNSKQDTRAAAADWLAKLGAVQAVPAIKATLAKEKQDLPRVAMMNALETLGVPLDKFFDTAAMLQEAEKGLKKGIPQALAWFPFDRLPTVHWQEGGSEVPHSLVTWWIVQQVKLNNPEPGALLLRYCSMLRPGERERLGLFVLESWIAHDTKQNTREEAEKLANQQLSYYTQYYPNVAKQSLYNSLLSDYLGACSGSAIKEKGMLALVAACGGAAIVPPAESYIKRFYGQRAAQCKALIRMLSWVEAKPATQLLLAIATRFRTKGIQQEADDCVKALAERRGWTTDELADRTIPTAGFDDGPELILDYGSRSFTASLDNKFKLVLRNENGDIVSSLPDPRKDDDPELVKEAKTRMSLARKELKSVLKAQRERLYEAMCTQRTWRFDDWDLYLNQHPIIRSYCQNLVWTASIESQPGLRFRPLGDGTLTDHRDEEVKLPSDALIRLAHSLNTPEDERGAWITHFRDYEITPLFEQFTRPVYELPESLEKETSLIDFQGHMLEAFKLRGRALGLGYNRGSTEDKGWFYEYVKRLPGLGIEAVIEFTGNPLPEENRTVALRSLCFRQAFTDNGYFAANARHQCLGEVPPVLLSECVNDIRIIAADGAGFHPDWEKLTEY